MKRICNYFFFKKAHSVVFSVASTNAFENRVLKNCMTNNTALISCVDYLVHQETFSETDFSSSLAPSP